MRGRNRGLNRQNGLVNSKALAFSFGALGSIMSELKKKFRADPQIEKRGTATPVNCIFNEERPEITPARYCGGAAPGFAAALDGPANGASGAAVIFESTGLSPSTDWTLASCGLDPVICEPIVRTACGASA